MFSWIPIHREAIHRILEYRDNQAELLTTLGEMQHRGLKVISLEDEDAHGQTIPLAEMDPFTFLASFNRGVTDQARRDNWAFLKARWNLTAAVPDDFAGIPTLHNMVSRLFPHARAREKDHVLQLWQIAALAENGGIEALDEAAFNRCLKLKCSGIGNLTIGLFWINPEKFLATDWKTRAYGKARDVTLEPEDYQSYRRWMKEMTEQFGNNYPQVSYDAHLLATRDDPQFELTPERMQTLWARFHQANEGFTDFQNPGRDFVENETRYKRAILERFRQELGSERLSALVAQRQGIKAAKEVVRVLTANLVSFHAWNITLGGTNEAAAAVLGECLKTASEHYEGPDSTRGLFNSCTRHNLRPAWDALTVLLWALRPTDFFPVKISFYRRLSAELGHELPSGRPDAEKLHSLIEFGRAFWKALEPQKPADWVDVQSFIWCVCPGNYDRREPDAVTQGKSWGFTKWMVPVVDALRALGGSGTPKAVLLQIQELLTVPDSVLAEKMESGQSRFYNEVAWARQYLAWEGLVYSPERGTWALTPEGQSVVLDDRRAQQIAARWAERHRQQADDEPDDSQPPPEELHATDGTLPEPSGGAASCQYWTLAPGTGGELWEEFYTKGIAAIGWDATGDLRRYRSKQEIRDRLLQLGPGVTSKINDGHACWQFLHDIEKGDIIFAKQGLSKLLGYGVVEGDYEFDATRARYQHVRRVQWLVRGEWEMPEGSQLPVKTLTDMTPYPEFVRLLADTVGLRLGGATGSKVDVPGRTRVYDIAKALGIEHKEVIAKAREMGITAAIVPSSSLDALTADRLELELRRSRLPSHSVPREASAVTVAHWWLNANPKIWSFDDIPVGGRETYTSHNERGNKRQKYRNFEEAKPGDLVVGYMTRPRQEVVAVCKITKGLHRTAKGDEIEFEKVEQLAKPIAMETLRANPDLTNSEPLLNNQGSLFKLTEPEYEIIRGLIDEANIVGPAEYESYDKQRAMRGLFLEESQFDEMLAALKEKKNVVLQGAPGVGKTFVARRLAYALLGSNDPRRIEVIQFHQSYSYEDFIQGFRPTPKGHFELKHGVFHQFCRRAQRDEGQPYVFIIDEINRGNLSKIFGELMMLIEPDKRGKDHAIPLAYSLDPDERFYIPENLHLIGMMNTADRSLAMVDYALRRRFRFIMLRPEFSTAAFRACLEDAGAARELVTKIVERMTALNEIIAEDAKNLGPGYQIGHSYFCPPNGVRLDEDWYRRVIESEIVPLLQEYWFDSDEKVREQRSKLLA